MDNEHISEERKNTLRAVDYAFTVIFTLELIVRVIADGLYGK